jgi:hypothetical protein
MPVAIKTLVVDSPFEFGVPRSHKTSAPSENKFARKQQAARNGEITSHKYRAQAHVSKRDATKKKLTEKRSRKTSQRAVTSDRTKKLYECG